MEDIENIIKRYQRELLEFSSRNKVESQQALSANAMPPFQDNEEETVIETPQPVVEQPAITALPSIPVE